MRILAAAKMINKRHIKTLLQNAIPVLVVFILTFPAIEPDFSIGLDNSYFWAFNHLFFHSYNTLKELVYPYGPLAFLRNPVVTAAAFEIGLIFYSCLKLWFIAMFILLVHKITHQKIVGYIVLLFILLFLETDHLIIGLSFIYSLLFLYKRNDIYILITALIASLGLFIKSSIGVACFSILFMCWLLDYYKNRNIRYSLYSAAITLVTLLVAGLSVFFNFSTLINYVYNTIRLSVGYSSALSIEQSNNWWALTLVIFCLILPFFINKNNRTKFIFLLLLPTLFAAWKHAMTRQDESHLSIMFSFLFFYWGIFLVYSEINKLIIILLATISLSLYYHNMNRPWNFSVWKYYISGVTNFQKTALNYKKFTETYAERSAKNIEQSRLSEDVISLIGNQSVDAYPWELSFFAANKELNWKPRRTLQSGSFDRWLDAYNAEDFSRTNGPEYIIFHYVEDQWGGWLGSIDNRYLLNDNPLTIYNIFNNYNIKYKNDQFLLLKKSSVDNLKTLNKSKEYITQWDQWISVGDSGNNLSRILVTSRQNLLGKIKNFFYQTETYFIDYMTQDGKVYTFRFIPENARDGLWIYPFIRFPQKDYIEDKVLKIRFRCTYPDLNKKEIKYQFQTFQYFNKERSTDFNNYFSKNKPLKHIYPYFNYNFNSELKTKTLNNLVNGNGGFSYTYSVLLDSIWNRNEVSSGKLLLETELNYFNDGSEGFHIVALSNAPKNFWKSKPLNNTKKEWNNSLQILELNKNDHKTGEIKIYVWNTGKNRIFIDDFKVRFKSW